MEEGRPINVRHQFIQRLVSNHLNSENARFIDGSSFPIEHRFPVTSFFDGQQLLFCSSTMELFPEMVLLFLVLTNELPLQILTNQRTNHIHCPRSIQYMDRGTAIVRSNFYR